MIQMGSAAVFDLKLLVTVLGALYGALAAACRFGVAASSGGGLPGMGG